MNYLHIILITDSTDPKIWVIGLVGLVQLGIQDCAELLATEPSMDDLFGEILDNPDNFSLELLTILDSEVEVGTVIEFKTDVKEKV